MNFKKIAAGKYVSDDNRITIEGGSRRWWVQVDGGDWGEWEYRDRYGRGHGLKPFKSLNESIVMIEEYEVRGLLYESELASKK